MRGSTGSRRRCGVRGGPTLLVLGHGAGGGIEARDLVAVAAALPLHGIEVALVEQPWRVAGKRVAVAPRQLDVAWTAVLAQLRAERGAAGEHARLVVGGRSAGARVGLPDRTGHRGRRRAGARLPAAPPGTARAFQGRRAARQLACPSVVVQGERDPFGAPADLAAAGVDVLRIHPVPDADHGFAVRRSAPITQAEALELVVAGARAACGHP